MDWKLEVVVVPVADVDRAKRFYSEQVGFIVDHDTQIGENTRVIQLTPPGSACSIVVGAGMVNMVPGSMKGFQLVVSNIDKARSELVARNVAASTIKHYEGMNLVEGRGGKWNSFIFFSDPDGNEWVVQERPSQD